MFRTRVFHPFALALVLALPAATAHAAAPSITANMPPEVPSWREEILPKKFYQTLADRWRDYARSHPKSAVALVQIVRALRYAGAPEAERNELLRKAYKLDPKCPEALDEMAATILRNKKPLVSGFEHALEMGKRAAELAPGWPDAYLDLWPIAVYLGRDDEAREALKRALDTGAFKPPILDFGFNMLQSAEPDAVVFTNGDNDTYPPLALQAARGVRTDVRIVNLSLLNLDRYSVSVWQGGNGKAPFTRAGIEALRRQWNAGLKDHTFSTEVVNALVKKVQSGAWTGPVYFAITVYPQVLECCGQTLEIEGVLLHLRPEPLPKGDEEKRVNLDRTLRLFRDDFRLESASDLSTDWRPEAAAYMMMTNYAAVLSIAASKSAEEGRMDDARYALRTSLAMMKSEGNTKMVNELATYWKKLEPKSAEPERWLR